MKPPQAMPAGMLNRRLQEAEAAWERKDFQACLDHLESARRLAPANIGILLQLGRIHGLRYDYAAASRCFDQALRLVPHKLETLVAVAEHCQNFRNPAIAMQYLQQAVNLPEATPLACVKLAELYERMRRIPEARNLAERAIKLAPACPEALLTQARLERTSGDLETAHQILQSFIHRPIASIATCSQSWYELATILDRQGHYDEAMAAYLQAKKPLQPQAPRYLAELKSFRARLKAMETQVTPTLFQRWISEAPRLVPVHRLAFLTGHARSGTTLLEQVLDSHPDIISAEETTNFIDYAFAPLRRQHPPDAYMLPVLETASTPQLQQARGNYLHAMELSVGTPTDGRLLMDKNPTYAFLIPAFLRVFPETKFLIALRDPRDVVMSCFMQPHPLPLNPVTAANLTLADTVQDYCDLMSIWRTLKPLIPGHFLEIRYEDMVADLESVARKTLEFLEVPWDAQVLGFDEHARKKLVISPTYADVTQKIYQRAQGRWRNYQKYLEPHLAQLEPFVKAFGYG